MVGGEKKRAIDHTCVIRSKFTSLFNMATSKNKQKRVVRYGIIFRASAIAKRRKSAMEG